MFQLKQISIKPRLTKNWKIFTDVLNKLKAHFKIPEKKARFTEEDIFRKPTNKTWVPNNNYHSIETFIEAASHEINSEIEKTKRLNY